MCHVCRAYILHHSIPCPLPKYANSNRKHNWKNASATLDLKYSLFSPVWWFRRQRAAPFFFLWLKSMVSANWRRWNSFYSPPHTNMKNRTSMMNLVNWIIICHTTYLIYDLVENNWSPFKSYALHVYTLITQPPRNRTTPWLQKWHTSAIRILFEFCEQSSPLWPHENHSSQSIGALDVRISM